MGMAAPTYFTAEMVRALPDDGQRYEVVHGELLVTPAPRLWHQEVARRLEMALGAYLEREPIGLVVHSPADISLRRTRWSNRTYSSSRSTRHARSTGRSSAVSCSSPRC